MVSLTDHDDIEAPSTLHVLPEMGDVPISLEWSAPYGPSFFHIGVHNLPARWAHGVVHRLLVFMLSNFVLLALWLIFMARLGA